MTEGSRGCARLRRFATVAGLATALQATACVTNPVTGRPEFTLMSPAQEAAIGRQEAAKVEAQIGLVRDPRLTEYVDALGQRIARASPRKDTRYRFFVADMPEPNAFALPGGYIYVSRGLLAISNSEAELAGVIGHEIGHVAARHSAQRQTRAMGVGLLTMLGVLAAGPELAQAVGDVGQMVGAGLIASYSRDQEREADRVGQDMAAATGFDPAGVSDFLRTLGRDTQLRLGSSPRPTFFDSHPGTQERVQTTGARAREIRWGPPAPMAGTREAFFAKFDGILVGPDPKAGVFDGQTFLHPELDFTLEFPSGWRTVNQPSAVAGISPREDALLTVEIQSGASDPESAARAFFEQTGLAPQDARSLRIGGLRAYGARTSAQTQSGAVFVDLTWISHPRGVFRITGSGAPAGFDRNGPILSRAAGSFRRLQSSDRARIKERRLDVVRARSGESIGSLSARTGNVWSIEETAVANGVDPSTRFREGEVVKVVTERTYRP